MNAILFKLTPPNDINAIDSICEMLHKKAFSEAETATINLIQSMTDSEYNTAEDRKEALKVARMMYNTFNNYFSNWAEDNHLDSSKELKDLYSTAHSNILFAHCGDPESMDDMVYELTEYLTDFENDALLEEVQYHLDCYRRQNQI